LIKQATIREFAKRFNLSVFIETGTFLGEMVAAMQNAFTQVISIELSRPLYERAKRRYHGYPNIQLWYGDSAHVLPEVLATVGEPALFWLDGHYSDSITEKGDLDTPIKSELAAILSHGIADHVILIDDARCFDGRSDYPSLDELEAWVSEKRPGLALGVSEDIIRIHPRQGA